MSFLTITLILFLIMDPIGNISSILSLMKGIDKKQQAKILLREMLIALGFMYLFYFIGEALFSMLSISEVTANLTAGLILFITALQILFPTLSSMRKNLPKGTPFLIPIAIPLVAGPSLLATVMIFARTEDNNLLMAGAIFTAWAAATIVLFCANYLHKLLRENGLVALEKLMGMILVLLSVQRFLDGIKQFLEGSA